MTEPPQPTQLPAEPEQLPANQITVTYLFKGWAWFGGKAGCKHGSVSGELFQRDALLPDATSFAASLIGNHHLMVNCDCVPAPPQGTATASLKPNVTVAPGATVVLAQQGPAQVTGNVFVFKQSRLETAVGITARATGTFTLAQAGAAGIGYLRVGELRAFATVSLSSGAVTLSWPGAPVPPGTAVELAFENRSSVPQTVASGSVSVSAPV